VLSLVGVLRGLHWFLALKHSNDRLLSGLYRELTHVNVDVLNVSDDRVELLNLDSTNRLQHSKCF
jgi:hypothetical protein